MTISSSRLRASRRSASSSTVPTPGRLDRRGADIQSVYVVPEFRDAGVGTALLAALRQEARNRELEIVTVHSSERAVSLYQRGGFEGSPRRLHWLP